MSITKSLHKLTSKCFAALSSTTQPSSLPPTITIALAHVIDSNARPHFFYNRLGVHTPECETFNKGDARNLHQRPIAGHFLYEKLIEQRRQALKPKRHPVEGASNVLGVRIYQRRLRDLTPALCGAVEGRRHKPSSTPNHIPLFVVPLTVNSIGPIASNKRLRPNERTRLPRRYPPKLHYALDNPIDNMDGLARPAIQHIQVLFEPHGSFSERMAGQLLVGLKTCALEESPRGEKRKRDEMDVAEEGKSVKSWDAIAQPAAGPG
ncbi:hypothetical protein FMUND_15315 [Fusarium mundagurra]|uniref:Uncharacterized protein n=1 Tax=Fusarium mundagurra TaxID=1567541 RepID=A0A8H5XPW5_9HYPO|nr:hypothetical protein FMUND_15315 [Fusarium mundagurra]